MRSYGFALLKSLTSSKATDDHCISSEMYNLLSYKCTQLNWSSASQPRWNLVLDHKTASLVMSRLRKWERWSPFPILFLQNMVQISINCITCIAEYIGAYSDRARPHLKSVFAAPSWPSIQPPTFSVNSYLTYTMWDASVPPPLPFTVWLNVHCSAHLPQTHFRICSARPSGYYSWIIGAIENIM